MNGKMAGIFELPIIRARKTPREEKGTITAKGLNAMAVKLGDEDEVSSGMHRHTIWGVKMTVERSFGAPFCEKQPVGTEDLHTVILLVSNVDEVLGGMHRDTAGVLELSIPTTI